MHDIGVWIILLEGGSFRVFEILDVHFGVFFSHKINNRSSDLGVYILWEQHPYLPLSPDTSDIRPDIAIDNLKVECPGISLLIFLGCSCWPISALCYGI